MSDGLPRKPIELKPGDRLEIKDGPQRGLYFVADPDNLCAVCRARLEHPRPEDPRIDWDAHEVGGHFLPAAKWAIFETLYFAHGRKAATETLMANALKPDSMINSENPARSLRVHIHHLRELIDDAGFGVEVVWGWGYRLLDRRPAPAAEPKPG